MNSKLDLFFGLSSSGLSVKCRLSHILPFMVVNFVVIFDMRVGPKEVLVATNVLFVLKCGERSEYD